MKKKIKQKNGKRRVAKSMVKLVLHLSKWGTQPLPKEQLKSFSSDEELLGKIRKSLAKTHIKDYF